MIKFSLACNKRHRFDGWFASGDAYDSQAKRKLVTCPVCGTADVRKALMSPRITGTRQNKQIDTQPAVRTSRAKPRAAAATELMATQLPAEQKALLDAMRQLRKEVAENAEYVGPKFADEARKIHHEEAPARGIYGEATPEEAKALHEEGVTVYPLPVLPEDKN
jgi:hypothetical protein